MEKIDTLVIGAGQAGIAMSEHLTKQDIPHLVVERDRIAENWRTGRWDSLVANGPAWHDRFPGLEFSKSAPGAFAPKEEVADYFADYAQMINAPIRCGVNVKEVRKITGQQGFRIETSDGLIGAANVVAATGAFHTPVIPAIVPDSTGLNQIHSYDYRNPAQLAQGAVMVVGAGSSGVQIADELMRAGRKVYLSVGPHDRPPRSYRGRDFTWWLGVLGLWDIAALAPGTEHVTIAVSGAGGGHTIDFRTLAAGGMTLVGRTEHFDKGVLSFNNDLAQNIAGGDENYLSMLDAADAYILRNGLDFPPEPEVRKMAADPECLLHPILALGLAQAGVTTIIWATGFSQDFSWLRVDAFDDTGRPAHQRGVSTEQGIYFLGLPWQSRRGSSFIWGVWHDAKYLADQISIQRMYREYSPE